MELNKRAMKFWNQHNSVTDQNASQAGQTALKEPFAELHSETASTTQQPRGEHRGTIRIARLQAPRGKDKGIIHSPQSSPLSLEFGTKNVHEGTKNVNETHNLQNDQGADEF